MSKEIEKRIGYIYKIVSPNGKIYIGQTINKKQRKYHYKNYDFKQQIKLWNSCVKYNWNPIDTFEIIEETICGINKQILNEREKYWIGFYDSFNNGLNCNEGGEGNVGYKFSTESIKKMSESKIGVKHPEWRNQQKSEYTKGRKHTEDAKLKMSRVKKERMNDLIKDKIRKGLVGNQNGIGNIGRSKKILCLTNNVTYDSIKHASEELNFTSSQIIDVCKNRRESSRGFKFIYI